MTWTLEELDALLRAFARGTLKVSYDGRMVEYGSADDLLKRIEAIKSDIARGPVAGVAGFRRGDR